MTALDRDGVAPEGEVAAKHVVRRDFGAEREPGPGEAGQVHVGVASPELRARIVRERAREGTKCAVQDRRVCALDISRRKDGVICHHGQRRLALVVVAQLESAEGEQLAADRQGQAALAIVVQRIDPEQQRAIRRVVRAADEGGPVDRLVVVGSSDPESPRRRETEVSTDAVLPPRAAGRIAHLRVERQPRDPPPRRAQAEVGPIHAIEVKEVGVGTEEHGRTDPVAHARPKARRHALEGIDSCPRAALRRRERNRAGTGPRGAVRVIGSIAHHHPELAQVGRAVALVEAKIAERGHVLEHEVAGNPGMRHADVHFARQANLGGHTAAVPHGSQPLPVADVPHEVEPHGAIHTHVDAQHVVRRIGDVDHADEQRRRVRLGTEREAEHPAPLHGQRVQHPVRVVVQRVVGDGRDERIAAEHDPLAVEVHDLAHGHQVVLGAQIVRLAPGEDRLLVMVGLLPVRRGARLRDQQDGSGGIGRLRQVATHELHGSGVMVVVNPVEQLVLAGDRGPDDAARRVLRRRHGHRG